MLPTPYQEFIYKRSYSRYLDDKKRREEWGESVYRYHRFFYDRLSIKDLPEDYRVEFFKATSAVFNLNVMPSMRCMWTAGKPLELENISGYNCAFTAIYHPRKFAEILYILMCGTGMGFSTERKFIKKLPKIPKRFYNSAFSVWVIEDSRKGWAEAYEELIKELYDGSIRSFDFTKIRPKGASLKTFGGRASGPDPLVELFNFTWTVFRNARGRKLTSIECYDIVCKIANCVVAGGVRRSAGINLSDLSDRKMRKAKSDKFWIDNPQRGLTNNSAVYTKHPSIFSFVSEWLQLAFSGTGERGIVNRKGIQDFIRKIGRRNPHYDFGTNPCGEILLRVDEFCNLSEAIVRPTDSLEYLLFKVRMATILGICQSTLTDFGFIAPEWKKNCEEERLLGVSLTGLMDHPVLQSKSEVAEIWLRLLRLEVIQTSKRWAKVLNINEPVATTCVKPSGTVSQLVDSSSGMHSRYAPYYIRRVQVTYTDPLCQYLIMMKVPCQPVDGQTWDSVTTVVFEFPVKAPYGSVYRDDRGAITQLEYWKMLKEYWCEHNPSCTIYVKPNEWLKVGWWVWKNWDSIGGLSFFPKDNHVYPDAPYEEITQEEYEKRVNYFPTLDFTALAEFETEDNTNGSKEYACAGGACEL